MASKNFSEMVCLIGSSLFYGLLRNFKRQNSFRRQKPILFLPWSVWDLQKSLIAHNNKISMCNVICLQIVFIAGLKIQVYSNSVSYTPYTVFLVTISFFFFSRSLPGCFFSPFFVILKNKRTNKSREQLKITNHKANCMCVRIRFGVNGSFFCYCSFLVKCVWSSCSALYLYVYKYTLTECVICVYVFMSAPHWMYDPVQEPKTGCENKTKQIKSKRTFECVCVYN